MPGLYLPRLIHGLHAATYAARDNCDRLLLRKPFSRLMQNAEELEVEAEELEAQAVQLETQDRPVAAQVKLQQAKSRRDHATTLRQQAGEPQKSVPLE